MKNKMYLNIVLVIFFQALHSMLNAQISTKTGIYECKFNDSTNQYLIISDYDSSFLVTKYDSGEIEVWRKSVIHWDNYEIIVSPHCTHAKTEFKAGLSVQSRIENCGPFINTRYVWSKNYTELILYSGRKKTKLRYQLIAPGITFKTESEVKTYF